MDGNVETPAPPEKNNIIFCPITVFNFIILRTFFGEMLWDLRKKVLGKNSALKDVKNTLTLIQ